MNPVELNSEECIIIIDKKESNAIQSRFVEINTDISNSNGFISDAELSFHEFPRDMRKKIVNFKRNGNKEGALLIKGLPTPKCLPQTPSSRKEPYTKSLESEYLLAAIGTALGEPVGYIQDKAGKLFQDVFPTKADEAKQTSDSSKVLLEFHTETAFHPFIPEFVMLYCLRQDPKKEAKTIFSSIRNVHNKLTQNERKILSQKIYRTGIDIAFGNNTDEKANMPDLFSVLDGDPIDPHLRYDIDLMTSTTKEGETALNAITKLLEDESKYVKLEPGDLLIIDNKRTIHARSEFTAFYNGNDRWLQRLLVLSDLKSAHADLRPGERIIRTDFSKYLTKETETIKQT